MMEGNAYVGRVGGGVIWDLVGPVQGDRKVAGMKGRDMSTTYMEPAGVRTLLAARAPLCPKCGHVLYEVDREVRRGSVVLWYECSGPECEDRWFEKRPAKVG